MNKKERIIEIASQLFSQKGYENTSLSTICKKANVSKGLVSHHFKSKDGLLSEVFLYSSKVRLETIKIKTEHHKTKDSLTSFLDSFFEELKDKKLTFQFQLNMMTHPKTRGVLNDLIQERSNTLFNYTNEIFKRMNYKNSTLSSYIFLAELNGITLSYLNSKNEYPLSDLKNYFIKKYMNNGI